MRRDSFVRAVIGGAAVWVVLSAAHVVSAGYTARTLYLLLPPADGISANPAAFYPPIAGGQASGLYFRSDMSAGPRAMIWMPTGTPIDMTPTINGITYTPSEVIATDGTQQVGYGSPTLNHPHAIVWSGTPGSAVDLQPVQITGADGTSAGYGVGGGQQVGYITGPQINNETHAVLWSGSAGSAVDLHPAGYTLSYAYGTDGFRQVGAGQSVKDGQSHALLWEGSPDSVMDLSPTNLPNFKSTFAYGIRNAQQVGYGVTTDGTSHALLWTGGPNTAVDVTPTDLGFANARAYFTDGLHQVGFATDSDLTTSHAMLWSGSASSAVDLSALLPADLANSTAYSIDPLGNIYGLASTSDGYRYAVEWAVTPEPTATLGLLTLGAASLLRRRRFTLQRMRG